MKKKQVIIQWRKYLHYNTRYLSGLEKYINLKDFRMAVNKYQINVGDSCCWWQILLKRIMYDSFNGLQWLRMGASHNMLFKWIIVTDDGPEISINEVQMVLQRMKYNY